MTRMSHHCTATNCVWGAKAPIASLSGSHKSPLLEGHPQSAVSPFALPSPWEAYSSSVSLGRRFPSLSGEPHMCPTAYPVHILWVREDISVYGTREQKGLPSVFTCLKCTGQMSTPNCPWSSLLCPFPVQFLVFLGVEDDLDPLSWLVYQCSDESWSYRVPITEIQQHMGFLSRLCLYQIHITWLIYYQVQNSYFPITSPNAMHGPQWLSATLSGMYQKVLMD